MLRNVIIMTALLALTPALAIAAPVAMKPTNTAMTQPVKAHKVALTRHHKAKIAHQVRLERHRKAKAETIKS